MEQLDFGAGYRFGEVDAIAEAVEGGALRLVAQARLRAGSFGESDATAMAGEQQVAFGFGFFELLFELDQRVFQRFHLGALVLDLFAVAYGELG